MTTERLYYGDSYLKSFTARVTGSSDNEHTIYLDRTAFYPASGGQPFDKGSIGGVAVMEVVDEGERIAHKLAGELTGVEDVDCMIDWPRRFDHMQQHTGQHLLSAVFAEVLGWQTISFHLGSDVSTIDLVAVSAEPGQLAAVERRANEVVTENRSVLMTFEDAATTQGLRKETDRKGTIRVISIEGLDRSACGGTHVHATGEIGPILLRGLEKIRGNLRVEFLCGSRASARARKDFDTLTRIAQSFSGAIDDTPLLVQSALARLDDSDKARRRLSTELASIRGRILYEQCHPTPSGFRVHRKKAALNDDIRAEAQAFAAGAKAVYIAWQESPGSVLVACSADAGTHAGNALKQIVSEAGGRGGGSAVLAQASMPVGANVQNIIDALESKLL